VKKSSRTDILYLKDIQTSMGRIAEYIEGSDFITFKKDYKTVDAVIRNFEIIGEQQRICQTISELRILRFHGMRLYYLRNRVAHEYFGIDYEIIWDIARNYLPGNKVFVDKIIDSLID
jgi:uncharacterized protein with HEPN domain